MGSIKKYIIDHKIDLGLTLGSILITCFMHWVGFFDFLGGLNRSCRPEPDRVEPSRAEPSVDAPRHRSGHPEAAVAVVACVHWRPNDDAEWIVRSVVCRTRRTHIKNQTFAADNVVWF